METVDEAIETRHNRDVYDIVTALDDMVGDCRDLVGKVERSSLPPEIKARAIGNAQASRLLLSSTESSMSEYAVQSIEGAA